MSPQSLICSVKLSSFSPKSTGQMVFTSLREVGGCWRQGMNLAFGVATDVADIWGGWCKGTDCKWCNQTWEFCTTPLRRGLQTYHWPAHWPAQLVQRGHTVEWRPQGIQLPLQQGVFQGSAAHANRGGADRKRVGLDDQGLAGGVVLVIQARFREE